MKRSAGEPRRPLRTIEEINNKIRTGDVVVCTASEFCDMVRTEKTFEMLT